MICIYEQDVINKVDFVQLIKKILLKPQMKVYDKFVFFNILKKKIKKFIGIILIFISSVWIILKVNRMKIIKIVMNR